MHKSIAKSRIGSNLPDLRQHKSNSTYETGAFGRKMMKHVAHFTDNHPDPTTELLLADIANPNAGHELVERFLRNKLVIRAKINGTLTSLFQSPKVFDPNHLDRPGKMEELLFAWLMAWLAVQPTDIHKLKRKNIHLIKNTRGRITELFVDYYKGRAQRDYKSLSLSTREIEGRAIYAYMQALPKNQEHCFVSTDAHKLNFDRNTLALTLINLCETPVLSQHLSEQLVRRKGGTIFLELLQALKQHGGQTYNSWKNLIGNSNAADDSNTSYQRYLTTIPNALNPNALTYSHIKTTSVQSRSDHYRMEDLVNVNSHQSNTEKIAYLTDHNKEWVNQNGRISRIVLQDMEQFVYRPNLNQAIMDAREQVLRTHIVTALGDSTTDAATMHIDKLGRFRDINLIEIAHRDASDILVMDSEETVVNMLHYIHQAEKHYHQLVRHALVFFERTVLPNVEWMTVILQQQLSPKTVRAGTERYAALQTHLPPLFTNELLGGVST